MPDTNLSSSNDAAVSKIDADARPIATAANGNQWAPEEERPFQYLASPAPQPTFWWYAPTPSLLPRNTSVYSMSSNSEYTDNSLDSFVSNKLASDSATIHGQPRSQAESPLLSFASLFDRDLWLSDESFVSTDSSEDGDIDRNPEGQAQTNPDDSTSFRVSEANSSAVVEIGPCTNVVCGKGHECIVDASSCFAYFYGLVTVDNADPSLCLKARCIPQVYMRSLSSDN